MIVRLEDSDFISKSDLYGMIDAVYTEVILTSRTSLNAAFGGRGGVRGQRCRWDRHCGLSLGQRIPAGAYAART